MMEERVKEQDWKGRAERISLAFSRNHFYFFLLGALLLPLVAVTCYAAQVRGVFFVALLSLLFSGGSSWYLLLLWEGKMQRSVTKLVSLRLSQTLTPFLTQGALVQEPLQRGSETDEALELQRELGEARRGYEHQIDLLQSSVAKSKEEVRQLKLEMDKKLEEMRLAYLEFEDLRKEFHRQEEEHRHAQEEGRKQLEHKESLNGEYQRTIGEQRTIIEKKQRYIANLEAKVRDLMYEIRSLLHLEETPNSLSIAPIESDLPLSTAVNTPYDLSVQLHRFIEKAENQTGMEHLGGTSPRFLNPTESYAVDWRRFFDTLRDERGEIVFVLSLSEKKFLFVNQHVKSWLGWSSEKFMKEFPQLVTNGYPEWKRLVLNMPQSKECQTLIEIESKSGESKQFICVMGWISKGPFHNHIIGILSQ